MKGVSRFKCDIFCTLNSMKEASKAIDFQTRRLL